MLRAPPDGQLCINVNLMERMFSLLAAYSLHMYAVSNMGTCWSECDSLTTKIFELLSNCLEDYGRIVWQANACAFRRHTLIHGENGHLHGHLWIDSDVCILTYISTNRDIQFGINLQFVQNVSSLFSRVTFYWWRETLHGLFVTFVIWHWYGFLWFGPRSIFIFRAWNWWRPMIRRQSIWFISDVLWRTYPSIVAI